MNENQKNIETCLPEDILAEVANVPTDAQFVSLVNESLDPLKQQAVEQAGWDAYEEVVETHKPYTFTSAVVQMKSNLILLLRRLWRFQFGTGTLRSLADMWSHYITRLSGNETYGIPSRLDQLTDLPSAPLLVADGKIGGAIGAPDGVSLAQLVGSSDAAASVTEITDDNTDWTWNRALPVFSNAETMHLACKHILIPSAQFFVNGWSNLVEATIDAEDLYFDPNHYGYQIGLFKSCSSLKKVTLKLKENHPTYNVSYNYKQIAVLQDCEAVEEIDAKDWSVFDCDLTFGNCPNLKKIVFGKITRQWENWGDPFESKTDLIHVEIGADTAISLRFSSWNPTNVLADQNNLQQFLQNFHDYIAERLATFPEGTTDKTLTLSAAVYSAIWDNNGDPLPTTICQEIDTIIVDTKHWRPNKAS